MNTMESAAVVGSMLGIVFARQQLSNLARFVGGGKATREPETPHRLECDYLVVGAGAASLAFVDTLLTELPRAEVVIVDRHDAPGGHWNDAYDFVRLHQPSIVYGLASRKLEGSWLWNFLQCRAPWKHRANKSEILAHFTSGVRDWVKSGRVRYYPRCEYDFSQPEAVHSEGGTLRRFRSCDGSTEYTALVRHKVVNGTVGEPLIPALCPLPFPVDPWGVEVITPNDLNGLKPLGGGRKRHYVVLGCGKTGVDTVVYLQRKMRVDPKRDITLIVPQVPWCYTRDGPRGPHGPMGLWAEVLKNGGDRDRALRELGRQGSLTPLFEGTEPTVCRYPVIGKDELQDVARVGRIVRRGRIRSVTRSGDQVSLNFRGRGGKVKVEAAADDVCLVNCCAPGPLLKKAVPPVFDGNIINLSLLFGPPVGFTMTIIGMIEASAQQGLLDASFCREEIGCKDPLALFAAYDIMDTSARSMMEVFLNLGLVAAIIRKDPAVTLRWLKRNRLSMYSIPFVQMNLAEKLREISAKRSALGVSRGKARMALALARKIEGHAF